MPATGARVGTLGYMAPEQVIGERDIGPSADLFALGAVLVYQLTLLYRFEHGQDLRVGLKAFLKAA